MKHEYISPWLVDDTVARASIGYRAVITLDGDTVCDPSPMGADNARLIASAPVLLDALQWLLKHDPDGDGGMPDYKELRHVCDRARSAIRCAIGDA